MKLQINIIFLLFLAFLLFSCQSQKQDLNADFDKQLDEFSDDQKILTDFEIEKLNSAYVVYPVWYKQEKRYLDQYSKVRMSLFEQLDSIQNFSYNKPLHDKIIQQVAGFRNICDSILALEFDFEQNFGYKRELKQISILTTEENCNYTILKSWVELIDRRVISFLMKKKYPDSMSYDTVIIRVISESQVIKKGERYEAQLSMAGLARKNIYGAVLYCDDFTDTIIAKNGVLRYSEKVTHPVGEHIINGKILLNIPHYKEYKFKINYYVEP